VVYYTWYTKVSTVVERFEIGDAHFIVE
jgi:hypothetical protein